MCNNLCTTRDGNSGPVESRVEFFVDSGLIKSRILKPESTGVTNKKQKSSWSCITPTQYIAEFSSNPYF